MVCTHRLNLHLPNRSGLVKAREFTNLPLRKNSLKLFQVKPAGEGLSPAVPPRNLLVSAAVSTSLKASVSLHTQTAFVSGYQGLLGRISPQWRTCELSTGEQEPKKASRGVGAGKRSPLSPFSVH